MDKRWCLEVVEFITEKDGKDGWEALGGKRRHVGYMNKVFESKQGAIAYYDHHNPHMRSLNAHGTLRSDWDPNTHLLYIVREFQGIIATVDPFE
jgi:hypothetical protein